MFETLIIQPIFNVLVFIHALVPGGNFGISIVLFTVVVRTLMWPLVRKQLRQSRAMRKMQPEIRKVKKAAGGDRQQESKMLMELYKEKGISPFSSFGTLIIQFIILIGLYQGLIRVIDDSSAIVGFAYGWLQEFPLLQRLADSPERFDNTFIGLVDLSRAAVGAEGLYIPALILVLGSAITQYLQSSQLMPKDEDAKTLKQILNDAKAGKKADPSETNAAIGSAMRYFIPVMIFFVTAFIASALSLYWFTSGVIAYWQQSRILAQDEKEMEKLGDEPGKTEPIEGEVIKKTSQETKAQGTKSQKATTQKATKAKTTNKKSTKSTKAKKPTKANKRRK